MITPSELREARRELGLSLEQMATMLGYIGEHRRQMQHNLETGRRPIRDPQRRLLDAYLSGYRPDDWPVVCQRLAGADERDLVRVT